MIEKNGVPFYARDFRGPKDLRKVQQQKELKNVNVVSNCGMVLGDPDIDAASRLFWPINTIAFDFNYSPNYGLGHGTWAPFNDQNTAISREIMPVFFEPHHR